MTCSQYVLQELTNKELWYEKRKKFISLCIEDASSHYKMFCALFVRSYLITVHLRKMQILQSLSLSVLYILVHAHICTYMITTIIITTIILFIFFTVTAYMKFYFHIWISCFMMVLHHTAAVEFSWRVTNPIELNWTVYDEVGWLGDDYSWILKLISKFSKFLLAFWEIFWFETAICKLDILFEVFINLGWRFFFPWHIFEIPLKQKILKLEEEF